MQAVFHPSQPNVQYPRYSSEHETKAAAAETTDIQPANSHTHTCHSTSLIWRFNLTVLLQFAPTITDIPLNHFWKISCEKLKFWSTCKQLVLWSSEWRFDDDQHRLDHSFLWLRCVSGVLNWLFRNQLNPVRLCVEGQTESLERRQMCSQITADQKWILDTTQLKDLELFCHAWKHFCQTVLGKFSQEYFKFFKQRSEMLKLSSPVCTVPRQQMSDKESWKGSVVRSHRHSTLFSMSLINSISGKRNILCRLNMPQVLMQEPAD